MQSINVKVEAFEGPFDLLYHLIEKNEINLYDIPIASLTAQYLAYIHQGHIKNMDHMSSFLVMAATLLEIKSKMLLPKDKKDNTAEEIDPREELVNRLIEYKRYKEVALQFQTKEVFTEKVLFKKPEKELIEYLVGEKLVTIESLLQDISLQKLFHTFQDILARKELKVDKVRSGFGHIQKDHFTVGQQMTYLQHRLKAQKEMAFSTLFDEDVSRNEVIVTFLAVLEMIKLKLIWIRQSNTFDEILITQYTGITN